MQHPCTKSAAPLHQRCSIGILPVKRCFFAPCPLNLTPIHRNPTSSMLSCRNSEGKKNKKTFRAVRLKKFFVFYPHTLTFYCNRLTDSNKGCEGKCEGSFLPSHFPSPLPLTPTILPAGRHPACHGDSMGVKEAAVYRAYSYAALSVQICCTLGARWLHFSGTIFLLVLCWTISMTYAVLSVYLCCTISIPMLDLWYQNALLFWYRFFNLFTGNIKAN